MFRAGKERCTVSGDGFPADIKHCMQDCILALLWPRNDIYGFFRDHGCTTADLKLIKPFKEENIARGAMVQRMFDRLAERPDGGLGAFRAMLKALVEWSHFDTYYFDKLAKLDRDVAQKHLAHLGQLVEIRDSKIKEQRHRRDVSAQHQQTTSETRQTLLAHFLDLYKSEGRPQDRGYALERLFQDLAKLEAIEVTGAFRSTGEQIDAGLKFDGENYLVELKWQDRAASTEPLFAFASKIEGKMYGRGLFVSINGFMPEPVEALLKGRALRTVLIDGEDMILVLEGHTSFRAMLDVKVRAAQLKGEIYVHALSARSKCSR
jgi:hypothetical protein